MTANPSAYLKYALKMEKPMSNTGLGFRSRFLTRVAAASGGLALVLAAATSTYAAESLPIPAGFELRASDGYTLSVMALEDPRTDRGVALLLMRSRHSQVFYFSKASVAPTSIEADLGALGRIDVDFVSSGQSRTDRSVCGDAVQMDSGRYEGTIDFEGEEGYSEVHASSARGDSTMALSLPCADLGSEGYGGHSPGARLTVRHRARRLQFSAMKNSPTRPARFAATVLERRRNILISRSIDVTAAPGSFDFDVPSGTAHVVPPKPFAGEASYFRPSGKSANWHGDLSIDFPGHAGVRLTGSGTRASLIRAVLNPGHPFRLR